MSASGLNEVSTIHTSGSSITTDTVRASTAYSVVTGHVRRAAGGGSVATSSSPRRAGGRERGRRRHSSVAHRPPAEVEQLEHAEHEDEADQHPRDRRRVAEAELAEPEPVDEEHEGLGAEERAA